MRLDDDTLRFSPTDLAAFSGCRQRTILDRLRAHGEASYAKYEDPLLELLQAKGIEHERAYLDKLRGEGKTVIAFEPLPKHEYNAAGHTRRAEETRAAMAAGADVIYQGTLYDGRWLGLVDFLIRTDDLPSDFGPYSYEVLDTKLSREAKATAIFQCCVYSELLEQVQGATPREIHLYLGGPNARKESFRLAHFGAYYRALKARFLAEHGPGAEGPERAPEPVDLCGICNWRERCDGERRDVDHLSLVAGIRRDHRHALEAAGITTLESLAKHPLDAVPEPLRPASFETIREQARIQWESRETETPLYELLDRAHDDTGRGLGLAALPDPSPHDWFFDLETASLATDHGLEYLWGVSYADDTYDAEWALTAPHEKRALIGFLRRALNHIEDHPDAHIYHYGAKEPSTLKRLTARYGEGTDELDALLKAEAFVDLLRVVKQGLRAGLEGYSLKLIEPLYGFERTVALLDANRARGVLEKALALKADGAPLRDTRPVVEGYNKDDCISTRALRDWLEHRRRELEARDGEPLGRPEPRSGETEAADESDTAREVRELMEGLLADVPDEPGDRTDQQHVRWLAAHMIEWHRREAKNWWWEYYRLRDLSPDELVAERKPLGDLEYVGCIGPADRSLAHRFRFAPQEHGLKSGGDAADLDRDDTKSWSVWAVDDEAGHLDLKIGKSVDEAEVRRIRRVTPNELMRTPGHRKRLRTTAERLLAGEDPLREWSSTSMGLLRRDPPRLKGGHRLPEIAPGAPSLERAREAALALDDGVLPVQGPPGTGKTFTGARMIRALLRAGYRVGVTAVSHKVITNLLDEVCKADGDDGARSFAGLQVGTGEHCEDDRFTQVASGGKVAREVAKRAEDGEPPFNLFAGTSWMWCSDHWLDDPVDVLFIDEAGQFSLADALAVAPSARNLVLLGDPQQLAQPQQGVHPPGTEASVLEHLAGEGGIVTAERGLFLEETWRMRPEITAYTSELFYKGQLGWRAHLEEQRLAHPDAAELHGLYHVPVPHEGNAKASEEEAAAVVALYRRLLVPGVAFTNPKKVPATRDLECSDLLVVAPYNAQVDLLKERLAEAGHPDAHVGTVDKFQGQEAAVAIYSLASSSAEEAPRGMSFLYALDRLNVATSRARCATIIVSSPAVFEAECRTPEQIRMVNAFVRYREVGREWRLG